MSDFSLCTPVVFLIFNRPDTTAQVFEAIRQAEPPQLLVVADGPRPDRPGEIEKCAAARAIIEGVDWDCDVLTNFAESNMGCQRRVSSGLNWVFDTVEEAIILEDDCVPHPTFFRFCEELLERYQDDERIMVVSGDNYQFGRRRTKDSYYFSLYPHCWGWATWKRAWRYYDRQMQLWPLIQEGGWLQDILEDDERAVAFWTRIFEGTYKGDIDSWAFAWTFACWVQSGLTILPNVNLVSNIGYGPEATHTTNINDPASKIPRYAMNFPLSHPPYLIRDASADRFTQRNHFDRRAPLHERIKYKGKMLINNVRDRIRR